jgi:putative PIN family toxin of toxin-antitoxin system
MRAVLDTNILARPAYRDTGPAGEVLHRLSKAPHILVISSFILQELRRVLRYPRLRRLPQLSDQQIDSYVTDIETVAVLIDPQADQIERVVPDDPDDDLTIATAVAGNADVLCTLDQHLRRQDVREHCKRHGVDVMTDVELLEELRRTQSANDRE